MTVIPLPMRNECSTRGMLVDKRLVLALGLTLLIAAIFWTGSRYPALNEKALMVGNVHLADPLSFESTLTILPEDHFFKKILFTTGNWISSNRQGMSFGLLFAAAFLTVLPLIKRPHFRSEFGNTVVGVALGTPLGVCVNCAAPIARALHTAGTPLETTLATMISSPTLNVVVLIMLFSMFPLYMVLIKLGLTVVFLFIVIPLLCRILFRDERLAADGVLPTANTRTSHVRDLEAGQSHGLSKGWREAWLWMAGTFPRNLWFVVKTTVPLMLAAGLLGAAVMTILPWDNLLEAVQHLARWQKLLSLGLISVLGLFLPVPIAFDVFICSALLAAGMPAYAVMALLFTLGIFSVYSFFIVGRTVSWRVACMISLVLLGCSVGAGASAHYFEKSHKAQQERLFWQTFSHVSATERPDRKRPEGEHDQELNRRLQGQALRFTRFPAEAPTEIQIDHLPFHPRQKGSDQLFMEQDSRLFGFHEQEPRSLLAQFILPFSMLRGIAAGDVHNDGWADILVGSGRGVFLYANTGGSGFTLQRIDIPEIQQSYIGAVALVDLNNDGWLDMFLSTFRRGNFAVYNEEGRFLEKNLTRLPENASSVANAVAFGDVDRDGDLDVILGNWTSGIDSLPLEESRNVLLRQSHRMYAAESLPGLPGETLSTVLSDFNLDGHLDLIVGNDFDPPDVFYMNDTQGKFQNVGGTQKMFHHSTLFTMSIDSADVDNDLDLDIYMGQITDPPTNHQGERMVRPFREVCDAVDDPGTKARCETNVELHRHTVKDDDIQACRRIKSEHDRLDCVAVKFLQWAHGQADPQYCDWFPDRWADLSYLCRFLTRTDPELTEEDLRQNPTQVENRNLLFVRATDGTFADKAEEMGLDRTGWTWNAKFADVDNDEWQDLFVANGYYPLRFRESNMFFHNRRGDRFEDRTEEVGLSDVRATGAYTYVDYDNDGDLDIITAPFEGPLRVYRNQSEQGQAIAFELRDMIGNRFGIGSKIIIHYGDRSARHQMRELKAGGGYLSFDPPIAHFGLGNHATVERVEIQWSTGEVSEVRGDFASGARYRITRRTRASSQS